MCECISMHKPAANCFKIKASCAAVACTYVGVLSCSCTAYEDTAVRLLEQPEEVKSSKNGN